MLKMKTTRNEMYASEARFWIYLYQERWKPNFEKF